jgi:hypothetical protein
VEEMKVRREMEEKDDVKMKKRGEDALVNKIGQSFKFTNHMTICFI